MKRHARVNIDHNQGSTTSINCPAPQMIGQRARALLMPVDQGRVRRVHKEPSHVHGSSPVTLSTDEDTGH